MIEFLINDTPLQYVELVKNLGIWLTPTLNWTPQVNSILKKVHSSLGSLNFNRKALSITLKKQLVLTLVLPHFDYASVVFIDLDKTLTLQLQVAHNTCIRFIFGYIPYIPTSNFSTHLTHKRLELGWLSLTGRRHFQLALLMYRTIVTKTPSYSSTTLLNEIILL